MAEEKKKKIDELESSADSLLERLNGHFDSEKETDKNISGEEQGKDSAAAAKAALEDTLGGELTDEKYSELYEKYLGVKKPESGAAGYETLHGRILDLQKESGVEPVKEPDVGESIKDAETFVSEQDPEAADDAHNGEDDEYWAMMKTETVKITPPKASDNTVTSELKKNIADAENFVEENYSGKDEAEEEEAPVRNVDNYSTNPGISKKKEKKPFFIKKDKKIKAGRDTMSDTLPDGGKPAGEEEPEIEYDEAFIDRLGSTEELLAFEPPLPGSVNEDDAQQTSTSPIPEPTVNTAEVKKADAKKTTEEKPDPSDTAMMMMAFGYEPKKDEPVHEVKPEYDEYSFADTDELSTTANLGDTSMLETDTVQTNKAVTEMLDRPLFEYTDSDKNKEVFEGFKRKFNSLRLRLFATALVAAGLLIIEFLLPLFGVGFDDVGITVTIDWVLTFACAMLVCDRLVFAVRRLGKFRFDADTVTLLMFVFSLVTSVITLCSVTFSEVRMYNFTFAICAFFNLLSASLLLSRDVYAFKVISSQKTKRVIARSAQPERSREDIAFGEYLNDASDICKVKKTNFVSDFFANREEIPANRKPLAIFIPIVFVVAVAAFFVSMFVLEEDAYQSITNAYLTFMMCAPISVFLSYSYPAHIGAMRAYAHNAAMLSEATPEKYVNTAVITFSDEDAFPADRIKMKSVKVLDNNSIEKVIYYASSIFSKIGGPLAAVFKAATLDSVNSDKVEIKELSDQGIDAFVDGKHVVVGQPDYMENQCFETIKEDTDDEYGGKSNKRILYLACDEVVIAKFYIQYNTSPDFIYIVKHLYEDGICVAINTIDPCIDDNLLYKNRLDPEQYAIKVIKGNIPQETYDSISAHECGIASTGTLKGTVKTLLLCDKLMSVSKTNLAMKIVSSIIGAAVIGLLIAAGVISGGSVWTVLLPAAYQLFWLIPMFLVSKVYVR